MTDFLLFRRMLTPVLVQLIFWLGVIACIFTGIVDIARNQILAGLQILILGPILVRVFCEVLILFFRINETLTEIKNTVKEKS
jgi:hypothetical protein